MRALVLTLPALALAACDVNAQSIDDTTAGVPCECTVTPEAAPPVGNATLKARASFADADEGYQQAVVSFEHASQDQAVTNNDWDLLFGNDRHDDRDVFSVNTVTDDASSIVDLGEIAFQDAPADVDLAKFPVGDYEKHDDITVVEGHVYFVHTHDENTDQVAIFGVQKHTLNESVQILWFRSKAKDKFEFDWK